jgi:hypothetical protein
METQVQYSQHPQGMNPRMKQPQNMGDIIEQLPSDQTVPSHNEIRIIDTLFQQKKGVVDKILKNTKDILIIGVLFVIFSLPPVDELIKRFITITTTSNYILIGVKALLFMIFYFILNNFYLSRNK